MSDRPPDPWSDPSPEPWPDGHDPVLADVVEHLVPEAFDLPTCAERVAREPVRLDHLPRELAWCAFERWVDDRLLEALERGAYESPLTVVVTSDGVLLRRYVDCGCGQLACAVEAARSEVHRLEAPWVFGADLVRPAPLSGELGADPNVADGDVGPGWWLAPWFAEVRTDGLAATAAGVLRLEGEVVVDQVRCRPRQHPTTKAFHRVLYRHPARRRHPLR